MITRRLIVCILFYLLALTVVSVRLGWLQWVQGPKYVDQTRIQQTLPPQWLETVRGTIYDRNGRELAIDRPHYELCLHYKLTRLFDPRFWQYLKASYIAAVRMQPGNNPDPSIETNYRLARLEISQLADLCQMSVKRFKEEIQYQTDQAFTDDQIEAYVRQKLARADTLLVDLAQTTQIPLDQLKTHIQEMNDRIYRWQLGRARSLFYRRHPELGPKASLKGEEALRQDLSAAVQSVQGKTEDYDLDWLIGQVRLVEMEEPQPIAFISENAALAVEERFVGLFPASSLQNRPVQVRVGKQRIYPYGSSACHIIGQMGPVDTESRSASSPPTLDELEQYYNDDRKGAWGCERMFETLLRGRRGWAIQNRSREFVERIEPVHGTNIRLTLDIDLQNAVQQVLEGQNSLERSFTGAAVVLDVPTGEILAMVSVPAFDLNTYWDRYRDIMIDQPEIYWHNRAISKARDYQPGSTIKPILLLGALEQGILTPTMTMDCSQANKSWEGLPSDIHNHGPADARRAIKVSCNFYFVKLGEAMGYEKMVAWLNQAGLGKPVLAWPDDLFARNAKLCFNEIEGDLAPRESRSVLAVEKRLFSIGRGFMDATPLQMANTAATIARNGVFLAPTLIADPKVERPEIRLAGPKNAAIVQEGMEQVIYRDDGYLDTGTAYEAFSPPPWPQETVRLYGKTGSAQCSWFICFAQANDNRCLALCVVAEVKEDGGKTAAPLARDILTQCAQYHYLPPTHSLGNDISR